MEAKLEPDSIVVLHSFVYMRMFLWRIVWIYLTMINLCEIYLIILIIRF